MKLEQENGGGGWPYPVYGGPLTRVGVLLGVGAGGVRILCQVEVRRGSVTPGGGGSVGGRGQQEVEGLQAGHHCWRQVRVLQHVGHQAMRLRQ